MRVGQLVLLAFASLAFSLKADAVDLDRVLSRRSIDEGAYGRVISAMTRSGNAALTEVLQELERSPSDAVVWAYAAYLLERNNELAKAESAISISAVLRAQLQDGEEDTVAQRLERLQGPVRLRLEGKTAQMRLKRNYRLVVESSLKAFQNSRADSPNGKVAAAHVLVTFQPPDETASLGEASGMPQPLTEELLRVEIGKFLLIQVPDSLRPITDKIWNENGGAGIERVNDQSKENEKVAASIAAKLKYSQSPVSLEWSLNGFGQEDAGQLYDVLVNAVLNNPEYTKPANLKEVFVVTKGGPAPVSPTAKIEVLGSPVVGIEMSFDASGSSGGSGTISNYDWKITDDRGLSLESTGTIMKQTFEQSGLVKIQLTITTDSGSTAVDEREISISQKSEPGDCSPSLHCPNFDPFVEFQDFCSPVASTPIRLCSVQSKCCRPLKRSRSCLVNCRPVPVESHSDSCGGAICGK